MLVAQIVEEREAAATRLDLYFQKGLYELSLPIGVSSSSKPFFGHWESSNSSKKVSRLGEDV